MKNKTIKNLENLLEVYKNVLRNSSSDLRNIAYYVENGKGERSENKELSSDIHNIADRLYNITI